MSFVAQLNLPEQLDRSSIEDELKEGRKVLLKGSKYTLKRMSSGNLVAVPPTTEGGVSLPISLVIKGVLNETCIILPLTE